MADKMSVASNAIQHQKEPLKALSEEIWKNPELNFEEHIAHRVLTDYLEGQGFTVERQYCGIQTAFKAKYVYSFDYYIYCD